MNFKLIITGIFALIPIAIWAFYFYKTRPANKMMLFLAFVAGCFSAWILLFYQEQWGKDLNLIFFNLEPVNFANSLSQFSSEHVLQRFLVFIFGVGMMEEFIKHFVVQKNKPAGLVLVLIILLFLKTFQMLFAVFAGTATVQGLLILIGMWATFYVFAILHQKLDLQSIDQVILISIMSALGFAFIENIIYLQRISASPETGIGDVAGLFVLRSFFTVMVHVLCSGIFGYYYGISLFAGPYLQKYYMEKKLAWPVRMLRGVLRFSRETTFQELVLLQGLISAMVIHGIYNFILDFNLNLSDVLGFMGIQTGLNIPLHIIVMNIYLVAGFLYLRHILTEKKNHYKFGLVGTKVLPEKDYEQLLRRITELGNKKNLEEKLLNEKWADEKEMSDLKKKITYIKKYNLLEEKYLASKWISLDSFRDFKKQVKEIEDLKKQIN